MFCRSLCAIIVSSSQQQKCKGRSKLRPKSKCCTQIRSSSYLLAPAFIYVLFSGNAYPSMCFSLSLNYFKNILPVGKKKKLTPKVHYAHQVLLYQFQYAEACLFYTSISTLLNIQENGFILGKACQIPECISHLFILAVITCDG